MILSLSAAAEPEPVAAAVLGVVKPLDAVVGARSGLRPKMAELAGATRLTSFESYSIDQSGLGNNDTSPPSDKNFDHFCANLLFNL